MTTNPTTTCHRSFHRARRDDAAPTRWAAAALLAGLWSCQPATMVRPDADAGPAPEPEPVAAQAPAPEPQPVAVPAPAPGADTPPEKPKQARARDRVPEPAAQTPARLLATPAPTGPQAPGPQGQWPWAMRECHGRPVAYFGDRSGYRVPAGRHHAHLTNAIETLAQAGGGTLAIIGKGADDPYLIEPGTAKLWRRVKGDVELCGVGRPAVLRSSGRDVSWTIVGNHDLRVRNLKFDGVRLNYQRTGDTKLIQFLNVWQGNVRGECPLLGDSKPNRYGTLMRPAQRAADVFSGGGIYDNGVVFTRFEYEDTEMYDCDSNHDHHSMYINITSCLFTATNTIWKGASSLEVFRQLCRVSIVEQSLYQNVLDWDNPQQVGGAVIDYRGCGTHVFRDNIVRTAGLSGNPRPKYALASRARRDETGCGLPDQWPGLDAEGKVRDHAGTAHGDLFPELGRLLAAKGTDRWAHEGKIWDRDFWREVTAAPWRADQRVLTVPGASLRLHDTIRAKSGAQAQVWKISGANYHVFLDGTREFVRGDRLDGGGVVTGVATVPAQAIAENGHLFTLYMNGNVFEFQCVGGQDCRAGSVFRSYGSTAGTSSSIRATNRYYIVPRDTDADVYPGDGYDTAATPGDGWVERVIALGINNYVDDDWPNGFYGETQPSVVKTLRYHDGTYDIIAYEHQGKRYNGSDETHPAALVPTDPEANGFVVLLNHERLDTPLPRWWPQGDLDQTCAALDARVRWWDEPGAETGHPQIDHDGFPGCR